MDGSVAGHAGSPSHQPRTLFELRLGSCRYPLGGPTEPARLFCGKPAALPRPYCTECCRLAYVPVGQRRQTTPGGTPSTGAM